MDNVEADRDENHNFYLRYTVAPWSPEQRRIAESLQKEMGFKPISASTYEATSLSTDYVHNATNMISNLLNERRAELNDGDYEMVFVWDIGDIATSTTEHFAQIYTFHRDTNAQSLYKILSQMLKNLTFCVGFDTDNVVNIEDVDEAETEEIRERAPMYDALEKFYNEMSDGMRDDDPIINYELIEACGLADLVHELYIAAAQMQKLFHQRWKTARKCLEMVNKQSEKPHRKYTNVVVCENGIGVGAAQLLLSSNSKHIPIEHIFSLSKDSKKAVFERIQKRFGEKCVLVYITSQPDKASIPENIKVPIWEIKANDSIDHLCNALQNDLF